MRGELEQWQPCDSRGNSLACDTRNCQRIQSSNVDRVSTVTVLTRPAKDHFFRVAAAFLAERDRDAAERFRATLRAWRDSASFDAALRPSRLSAFRVALARFAD